MSDYVFFEIYNTFAEAKAKALELARDHGDDVRVSMEGEQWKVLVPEWVHDELTNPSPDEELLLDDEDLEEDLEGMEVSEEMTCPLCRGFGHSPASKSACPYCSGSGAIQG